MWLRMDDLDVARNRPGSAKQILDDLLWLGMDWDGDIVVQSARTDHYQEAFDYLQSYGMVFPCRCSRKELERLQPTPRWPRVRYPGTCRPENRPVPVAPDTPVAWRFRVPEETILFEDGILGCQQMDLVAYPGDFVIRRKDGVFAYQLASVVDDWLLGVTDVVRGMDLADSTARQIALFRSFRSPAPRFWHVPLMTDSTGVKLSKRNGSDSLDSLRAAGHSSTEIVGMLAASLGFCDPDERMTPTQLLAELPPSFLCQLAISVETGKLPASFPKGQGSHAKKLPSA